MKKLLFLAALSVFIPSLNGEVSYVQPERWNTEQMRELHLKLWLQDEKIKSILLATCGTNSIGKILIYSTYPAAEEFKKTCPMIKEFFEITIDKLTEHYENQEKNQKQIDRLQKELIVAQNDFFHSLNQSIQQTHEISTTNNKDELAEKLAAFLETLQNPQEVLQPEDRYNTTDGTH
jgi:hypothetical protein